jgi:hypothetical protein
MRNCKRCGKELEKSSNKHQKEYCDMTCRTRYNASKRYAKLKNNPEYKKKALTRSKKWIAENRLHFNDLVREKSRLFQIKIHKERIEKGLCVKCGAERDTEGLKWCSKCRQKSRQSYRKMREKLGYKPIR